MLFYVFVKKYFLRQKLSPSPRSWMEPGGSCFSSASLMRMCTGLLDDENIEQQAYA